MFGLISDGVGWQVVYATSQLVFGAFTHVALTASGLNLCLYINGVMQSCPSQTLTPQVTVNDLVIGALNNNNNQWNGSLDELTLYNRALTPNEILSIYAAGSAGKCRCMAVAHQLQQQLAAANATIAAQRAQIGSLQSQLNACTVQTAAFNMAIADDVGTLDASFQKRFGPSSFAIPGDTLIDPMRWSTGTSVSPTCD